MTDHQLVFKFILIGDSNVGKSCLLLRFLQGRFKNLSNLSNQASKATFEAEFEPHHFQGEKLVQPEKTSWRSRFKNQHEPTLGVQFGSRIVEVEGRKIKLTIWDTAGQESFKSITRSYYKGAIGALLFFDITQEVSFKSLKRWLIELRTYSHQKLKIVLIGSKADLIDNREVSKDEVDSFLKQNNIEDYFQVSSLSGLNVDEPFLHLARQINHAIAVGEINEKQSSHGVVFKGKSKQSMYKPISPIGHEKLQSKSNCCGQ